MNDEEIEKAILYYIIFEKENLEVNEKDFTQPKHIEIIKAIQELKLKKEDVNVIAINNRLKNNSIDYISSLGNHIHTASVDNLYSKLKELTKKRELVKLAREMLQEISQQENIDSYIEQSILKLKKIEYLTEKEENFTEQLNKTTKEIEENLNKKQDTDYYTGIFDLDKLTDGLHEGELTVIGARPRRWKNYICSTSCRKYCKKREKYSLC